MKKPSEEARRRYADYIKDYKAAIDAALEKEKKTQGDHRRGRRRAPATRSSPSRTTTSTSSPATSS